MSIGPISVTFFFAVHSFYEYVQSNSSNTRDCKCNYILFTKLPWPGDSEGTFRSSSQAATCPPVYHTRRRLHTVPFNAEHQAGKLWIPSFIVFGLTRPGIEPESTVSVADALFTRPLIGFIKIATRANFFLQRSSPSLRKSVYSLLNKESMI